MSKVTITYFSDVLCIWAYVAQARIEAIKAGFAREVRLEYRFCSVFGDTRTKITSGWKDRGGFEGYSRHVKSVVARFPHVRVHPDVWISAKPASSASPHLFLAALLDWQDSAGVETVTGEIPIFESVMWAFRRGFFEEGLDIADWSIQCQLARPLGVDIGAVETSIRSGTAFARLSDDYQVAEKMRIEGSPTFVLNEGRQKLFGNVGYRLIEANIKELLREPNADLGSWC